MIIVTGIITTWSWTRWQHCNRAYFLHRAFCTKSSWHFPFTMYADRNSSMVSINSHLIWERKALKTAFPFCCIHRGQVSPCSKQQSTMKHL